MPQVFKDKADRVWLVSIDVAKIKLVKKTLDVNLPKLIDDNFKPLAALMSDEILFVDVLYLLCKKQADELGVSDEGFGELMYGDTYGEATEAFLQALTDFFSDPRIRAGLKKFLQIVKRGTDKAVAKLNHALDSKDWDREIERAISQATTSGESSTNAQGSSE